jgi:hypothetical protein
MWNPIWVGAGIGAAGRRAPGLLVAVVLMFLAAGCGESGTTAPPDLPLTVASATITAAAGGTVALPDGTRVVIPPGALSADTTVTVSRPPAQVFHPEGWLASVLLEPAGTTFTTPVDITIPYDPTGIETPDDVALVHSSTTNEPRDVGGESSATELVTDVTRSAGRITGRISHFSLLDVLWVPQMFVSPLLPGRYLRSGDLLYALTDGDNAYRKAWIVPLHVGMFFDNATHDGVIESSLPTGGCNPPANGVVDWQGYTGDCGFPALKGQHVWAGARRPRNVTVAQGQAAVTSARAWLGTPYGMSGFGNATIGTGVDCVQLAELGWKGAGVNVTYTPRTLLTPYAQYSNTVPVTDIEVRLSEGEVRIPIVAAVRMTDILSLSMNSYDAAGDGRVEAVLTLTADVPDMIDAGRARLEDPTLPPKETGKFPKQAVKDLVLRPTTDDADLTQHFHLRVQVPSRGFDRTYEHFLYVHVVDDVSQPPPGTDQNTCKVGALCDYCETPQVGSAWLGEMMVIWDTPTRLSQFGLTGSNPTTGEAIEFTVSFQSGVDGPVPVETTFQTVTRNRIVGTYLHDPELTGFCCDWYTAPDGTRSAIYGAQIDLTYSGKHVNGTLTVHTKEGKDATIDVTGCTCPCT